MSETMRLPLFVVSMNDIAIRRYKICDQKPHERDRESVRTTKRTPKPSRTLFGRDTDYRSLQTDGIALGDDDLLFRIMIGTDRL
jgi:hypothetical protein